MEREGGSKKDAIQTAIIRVLRWKAACDVIQSRDHEEKIQKLESALKEMADALGATAVGKPSRIPKGRLLAPISTNETNFFKLQGISKATKLLLSELSTTEDIADVLLLYRDFTNQPNIADAVSLEDQQPSLGVKFGEHDDHSDPGVEIEWSMPPDTLAANLGFPGGLPLLFNKYRHRNGLSPWDPDSAWLFEDEEAQNNEDMIPFVPHWHQLAGTHAILRKVFYSTPDKTVCTGMMVADDVGLGKTCLATMVITGLVDGVQLQKDKRNLPPLLGAFLSDILSQILTIQ